MAITLTLRAEIPLRLSFAGITPESLAGQTADALAEILLRMGNQTLHLGELFRIGGEVDDETVILEGDLSRVDGIGEGMASGKLISRGPAGRFVGRNMTGGNITIQGSTGSGAGLSMKGGTLRIEGDTADDLGGIEPGRKVGMQGGTILVHGKAGHHVGREMRRGTIAVRGSCGDGVMLDAIAGTVIIFGNCGNRPGAGMRRGSLFLLGPDEPSILPTFKRGRDIQPLFGRLLLREFVHQGFPVDDSFMHQIYRVYHGDLLSLGLGEVLVPER